MEKQLLIYGSVVPLSRDRHGNTALRRSTTFEFAKDTNTVPLLDQEMARAAVEMPIVFVRAADGVMCVGLLAALRKGNVFVDDDARWTGRYVPAFFRRYPFVFSVQEGGGTLTLCVDEGHAGFNTDGAGERLFDAEGSTTAFTQSMLRFCEDFQAGFSRTQAFCHRLDEAGLLEEARMDFRLPDGQTGQVVDFLRVSPEKLRGLEDAKIVEMFRNGDLDLIHLHQVSMQLVEPLIARSLERTGSRDQTSDAGAEAQARPPESEPVH